MRCWAMGLAALAIACAPQATSPGRAASAPAISEKTVEVTPVRQDAGARPEVQASDAGQEDTTATLTRADAGAPDSQQGVVELSNAPLQRQPPTRAASLPLPKFVVQSALLFPSAEGHVLRLFDASVSCASGLSDHGHYVHVRIDWKRGARAALDSFTYSDGLLKHYTVGIEVLSAPSAPGSVGRVRLMHSEGTTWSGDWSACASALDLPGIDRCLPSVHGRLTIEK